MRKSWCIRELYVNQMVLRYQRILCKLKYNLAIQSKKIHCTYKNKTHVTVTR